MKVKFGVLRREFKCSGGERGQASPVTWPEPGGTHASIGSVEICRGLVFWSFGSLTHNCCAHTHTHTHAHTHTHVGGVFLGIVGFPLRDEGKGYRGSKKGSPMCVSRPLVLHDTRHRTIVRIRSVSHFWGWFLGETKGTTAFSW